MLGEIIDHVLHVDRMVNTLFQEWGWVAWALVFLVIFIETGIVVFPFLPGDSLLFACGAFAAAQQQPVWLFLVLIAAAALLGNTVNYFIGRFFGDLILRTKPGKKPLIKPEYIEDTHKFFERWGGWAVTLSRFLPIIRTITPFVSGVGKMSFGKFSGFNILGGMAWTFLFVLVGFFFGNFPWVKENFSLVVLALVLIPGIPALVGAVKSFTKKKTNP